MATHKINQSADKSVNHVSVKYRLQEGSLIILLAVAIFCLIALVTYHQSDPSWSTTGDGQSIANAGGRAGAWFADVVLYLLGYGAFLLPFGLAYGAWCLLRRADFNMPLPAYLYGLRATGFLLTLCAASGLLSLFFTGTSGHLPFTRGGILGSEVATHLQQLLNETGTVILLMALFLAGVTLSTGVSWISIGRSLGMHSIEKVGLILRKLPSILQLIIRKWQHYGDMRQAKKAQTAQVVTATPSKKRSTKLAKPMTDNTLLFEPVVPVSQSLDLASASVFDAMAQSTPKKSPVKPVHINADSADLPSLDLLDAPEPEQHKGYSANELEQMSREVEQKLQDFGVKAQVVAVHPGPVITRFELQPAAGVKASKITGLSRDLARSLSVMSVRVVEVIPGKSVVGLEVPNTDRQIVQLHDILSSDAYIQAHSYLTLALGDDIAGHAVVVDLAKMPHLLVAGTTGSGKSVGLNAMLLSLLYKATPKDVRMILVDPKMLELAVYDGIPHLLTPVVTDMKEAANALRWCVAEMERRYRLMAALGVRNLTGFNKKITQAIQAGEPLVDPLFQSSDPSEKAPALETLPYIVVLIDEFADMMMVVGKKVEQLIARIAQKARAAGIHLILATQRPSVDVITGLIKANVPTRIAFQVSSRVDSRTILDQQGAENLLGHGDMLYMAPGTGVPMRVHGAFVDDHEVHNVVNAWKTQSAPEYLDDILNETLPSSADVPSLTGLDEQDSESDPFYDQAVQIVMETRRASISGIQRRLKIGYNRAARLIESMEAAGLVGPMESNGNREILVPSRQEDN